MSHGFQALASRAEDAGGPTSVFNQSLGPMAAFRLSEKAGISQLPGRLVLSDLFSHCRGISANVQQIVDNLKCQSN
jgi:hypothetical protein